MAVNIITRISYHVVCQARWSCDPWGCLLFGPPGSTPEIAADEAREEGWVDYGPSVWVCPNHVRTKDMPDTSLQVVKVYMCED